MTTPPALSVRAKMLGVLLRDARQAAGKTVKQCAQLLGAPSSVIKAYEEGRRSPSMPELEVLAFYLDVPVTHYWGNRTLADKARPTDLNVKHLLELRQRLLGARLRQARLEAKLSIKRLSELTGLSTRRLSGFESGRTPIPVPELEVLVRALGASVDDLVETEGQIGEWQANRRAMERFLTLPSDVRNFVAQPINEHYLRLAMRLSELNAHRLRGIAEDLLDITY